MKNKKILLFGLIFLVIFSFGFSREIARGAIDLHFEHVTSAGLPDPVGGVKSVLANILNWMLGIIGFIAVIAFIISGSQYLLSAGDEKMIETAKRNMTYSIIGVIVALSGLVVIKAIDAALRGTLNF